MQGSNSLWSLIVFGLCGISSHDWFRVIEDCAVDYVFIPLQRVQHVLLICSHCKLVMQYAAVVSSCFSLFTVVTRLLLRVHSQVSLVLRHWGLYRVLPCTFQSLSTEQRLHSRLRSLQTQHVQYSSFTSFQTVSSRSPVVLPPFRGESHSFTSLKTGTVF